MGRKVSLEGQWEENSWEALDAWLWSLTFSFGFPVLAICLLISSWDVGSPES